MVAFPYPTPFLIAFQFFPQTLTFSITCRSTYDYLSTPSSSEGGSESLVTEPLEAEGSVIPEYVQWESRAQVE